MESRHKVIYFSDAIFLGGAEEYLKSLVPAIDRSRYELRVALTRRAEVSPLADFFSKLEIPVDYVETHHRSPIRNFLAPLQYFRAHRPSIVHFNLNNSFGCFFPALAAWVSRVPWKLATEHLTFELASGKRAGIRTKEVVKKILTFCLDYTLSVSKTNKEILVQDYGIDPYRIKLIRNGIDMEKFAFSAEGRKRVRDEFGITDDQVLVGTVARFSYQKGHEYTIEAIPKILNVFPQARFLWVGDGPEREVLSTRIQSLHLEPFVIFAGVRDDITDVLSALDIFLLTSIFEGLPLSVLEAMAVGLPVIATAVNGTPEAVVDETGILVPAADPLAVSKAAINLLSRPELRYSLGRQGAERVRKHFSRRFMIKQVQDLYDNLTSGLPTPTPSHLTSDVTPRRTSIIVLSWNKKELLQETLDALLAAVEYEGGDHEIILVDNGSTDGTQDFIRTRYPEIRLIELDRNYRFCRANNIGVRCAKNDIVVLLNNDVVVERDFLGPLLKGFDLPGTFAVSCQIFNYDQSKTREETGKTFGTLVFGCVHVGHSPPVDIDAQRGYVPVFYAGGGSSAFSRQKFLELGGFNEIYNPGYVEDTDLSYRAWKSGYRVLYCPASKVVHKHRSTNAAQLGDRTIDYLISRNLFIFFWQNVSSPKLFLNHLLKLPLRVLLELSRGNLHILRALLGALLRIPAVVWGRLSSTSPSKLPDEEVLRTVDYWFFYRHRYLLNSENYRSSHKILMISKRLPRVGLDGSWVVANLIRGLAARHKVALLAFSESDEDGAHVARLSKICSSVKTIPLYPYSRELKSSFLISKIFGVIHAFLLMRKEVLNELKNGDYDLVQCEYLHTLNFIPNLHCYPSLLTHHEVLSLAYERTFKRTTNILLKLPAFIKWKIVKAYEKRVCRKVKTVVTLSDVDRDYLKNQLGIASVQAVHSGVDLDYFRPIRDLEEAPNSLLFVGYFKHPPNVEAMHYFFRRVWPGIIEQIPEARVTLIGRFAPPEILSYSSQAPVTFLDSVPDLRPYLQQHALFVAPIITGAGLRGKILEAMAMERPVVATDLCVEGYSFHHGRELMIATNPKEFITHTVELLHSPGLRRQLGARARVCLEASFGTHRFTSDYEDLHREILQ